MPNILFVAGDVSGDIHAALVAREVLRRHPDWTLHAVGGTQLREAIGPSSGSVLVADTTRCSVIGWPSVVALLPFIVRTRRRLLHFLETQPLDAAVLCDWGGVNGRVLPHCKRLGIPALYYFPPRSWQKNGPGELGIVPFVTRVATPFPWSAQRLQNADCPAEWVGHPLLETVRPSQPRAVLRREFGLTGDEDKRPLIALLPGSRAMELRYIGPHLVGAAQILRSQRDVHFVVAVPRGAATRVRQLFPAWATVVEGRAADALLACDAAVVKSGTATLEAAVADAPQVVVYDVPPLLALQWVVTGMSKKAPLIAMPNIILERMAVQELLAFDCRPEPIARALGTLLDDAAQRERIREGYVTVRRALGAELPQGATQRTADILDEMLGAAASGSAGLNGNQKDVSF